MATLDWHCTAEGEVTLVQLLVTAERPERVRIENRLDGPVWPPRTEGVPEPGWDEDGIERRVEPGGRVVLGYACPAEPAEPPARIVESEPVERPRELTARDIVRTLGDGTPPRDVMPGPAETGTDATGPAETAERGRNRNEGAAAAEPEPAPDQRTGGEAGEPCSAWLCAVEERVEAAERLASAGSVSEAERAVVEAGGLAAVRSLRARLSEDQAALAALAERCERVRERAEDTEIPVDTLARIA